MPSWRRRSSRSPAQIAWVTWRRARSGRALRPSPLERAVQPERSRGPAGSAPGRQAPRLRSGRTDLGRCDELILNGGVSDRTERHRRETAGTTSPPAHRSRAPRSAPAREGSALLFATHQETPRPASGERGATQLGTRLRALPASRRAPRAARSRRGRGRSRRRAAGPAGNRAATPGASSRARGRTTRDGPLSRGERGQHLMVQAQRGLHHRRAGCPRRRPGPPGTRSTRARCSRGRGGTGPRASTRSSSRSPLACASMSPAEATGLPASLHARLTAAS